MNGNCYSTQSIILILCRKRSNRISPIGRQLQPNDAGPMFESHRAVAEQSGNGQRNSVDKRGRPSPMRVSNNPLKPFVIFPFEIYVRQGLYYTSIHSQFQVELCLPPTHIGLASLKWQKGPLIYWFEFLNSQVAPFALDKGNIKSFILFLFFFC